MSDIRIFAGESSRPFAERMCSYLGLSLGKSFSKRFGDGNTYVRFDESARNEDVYIVQAIGRDPNNEFMELLFWVDAFRRSSANSITVIIPYYGYAKADKKDEPRVSIRGRVCADCLETEGIDRVITMDLHAPQVQGFFKVPVDHLYARPLLCAYAQRAGLVTEDAVVVSPDAGFAKNARLFADRLGLSLAICNKVRYGHDEKAKVMEIIGDVKGKRCLVVDDFTTSGGTIVDVAHNLLDKGASSVHAFLSHAIVNEAAVRKIEESPLTELIVTDTVNCPDIAKYSTKMKVISAAPLFAEAVKTIHERKPMADMFANLPDPLIYSSLSNLLKM
ncbi:MAG: ribose-phosphate diphosphokinase [Clostridia bacterium]|nr:ribose-phosphate diphosphokinase [Clostridia bacterium]MBR3459707.1 ribose-phosphate diphosphokinase [Clostridia bacterium]MBR5713444.1 ribose-phosphate diphosphokinase [Clostridia bacterium]